MWFWSFTRERGDGCGAGRRQPKWWEKRISRPWAKDGRGGRFGATVDMMDVVENWLHPWDHEGHQSLRKDGRAQRPFCFSSCSPALTRQQQTPEVTFLTHPVPELVFLPLYRLPEVQLAWPQHYCNNFNKETFLTSFAFCNVISLSFNRIRVWNFLEDSFLSCWNLEWNQASFFFFQNERKWKYYNKQWNKGGKIISWNKATESFLRQQVCQTGRLIKY